MFLDEYNLLTSKCPISKLGEIFSYYYADINDVHILARDCIELDIRSAFPTICKIMFGEDNAFVKRIFSIEDKFERNKFIAIKLKAKQERENNKTKYIEELNNYCKQFTFGKVYNNYNDVNILEYKKDSLLFNGEIRDSPIFQYIEECINDNNVEFRESKVNIYIRFEKTSIYNYDNEIVVKGKFKDCPQFILEEVLPNVLLNGEVYNFNFLNKVKTKYSEKYFEILKQNNLINKIKYYFSFNGQFLDKDGKFTKNINEICPSMVLIKFLYPIISLLRSEK